MIEAIVKRIQDAGFTVHVLKGILSIQKQIGEEILGYDWAILPIELNQLSADALFAETDYRISLLEQAIAERQHLK